MANKVNLDAMIKRADFAQQSEASSIELGDKLVIDQLAGKNPLLRLLRKPDFQRETNHWAPEQVAALIKSFATGELIPSLILWKSDSFVFVIDGAHRLSALRAWVENDYGDGSISHAFYSGNISDDQKKKAKRTRNLVEKSVGRFSDFRAMPEDDLSADTEQARLASTIFTRSIHVQWIQGSQEVAETSFFKINTQGTVLDAVEELLLRNRNTPYAIAARSIVRSGTGHKYWSGFSNIAQDKIETEAKQVNSLLFQPDLTQPIKTLDLPLGGTSSSIEALKMLIDIFTLIDGHDDPKKAIEALDQDDNGEQTKKVLRKAKKVVGRMTGNDAPSLGIHPAVYFYTENGKHSRFLFLGVLKAFAIAERNNDTGWYKKFITARKEMERKLVERKSLINQALANINSRQRIDRVANMMKNFVDVYSKNKAVDDQSILSSLGLSGTVGELKIIDAPRGFSASTKSAAFLQDALDNAIRCNICGGYLDTAKAMSYDHITRLREGGSGEIDNAQIIHPFCNTGIKN